MASIAIVYHSGYGHTKVVAEAVHRGAGSVEGIESELLAASEFDPPDEHRQYHGQWDRLARADAIVFGTPTYMGSVSAGLKTFMEHTSPLWYRQEWKDKLAAGFTNSAGLSGDKVNTLFDLAAFAAQHSMVWVSQGLFYDDKGTNRLGAWMGLMTQADTDKGPDLAPPAQDIATAERFGARVAEATVRWARGQQ